jgi:hypothetical protein
MPGVSPTLCYRAMVVVNANEIKEIAAGGILRIDLLVPCGGWHPGQLP